ncbi:MAG: DUF1987 domain-containing protein [Thermoflexibacter sp.]|jgi:hypothetical protein|nr:DUF1987 domain-containing protein [Thermoflexibacter sp.]
MENIEIKGEKTEFFIPTVNFNAETGVCEIAGESYLEETFEFYQKLIDWLNQYTSQGKKTLIFNCKLTYFNTASSKAILEILRLLKNYQESGADVKINWFYHEWDDDMKMEVEDLGLDADVKIDLLTF